MNASSERSTVAVGQEREVDAPPLTADTTADVAIVGAGIAGLSAAYELARAGSASSCSTAARSAVA